MVMWESSLTRPSPRQTGHGSEMISPVPWQVGQVDCWTKKPLCWVMMPRPWQVGQDLNASFPSLAPVPWQVLQVTRRSISSFLVHPFAASSSVMSKS